LLSLLLPGPTVPPPGTAAPAVDSGIIYAGIELNPEDARVIALRVTKGGGETNYKLVYSDSVRLTVGLAGDERSEAEITRDTAQTVLELLTRLRRRYQIPQERVFLIGSSRLGMASPEGLVDAIGKATGKTLSFLDAETEMQLSIAGTISRLGKVGDTQIDNRNSSALIELNSADATGGYQLLKHSPSGTPGYSFVTMSLPIGAPNPVDASALRLALRREREGKPGMVNRKRVYLTGSVAWAAAALIHPEDQGSFVALTREEIERFAEKAARSPQEALSPDLSPIRDRGLRLKAESELQAVKDAFPPQRLIAGAEALKTIANEFEWEDKQIWFARFGYLGCLLSYVRLQAEK
jgi:hypothetical protein